MSSRRIYVEGANNRSPGDIDSYAQQSEGACVGFCHTWLAAFIHNDPQATHLPGFEAYMLGFLRYQANYLQANIEEAPVGSPHRGFLNDPEASSLLMDLLHLRNPAFQSRLRTREFARADTVEEFQNRFLPILLQSGDFATMVGFCNHVVAVARRGNTLYIFDPNYGLAHYDNPNGFSFDIIELINSYFTGNRVEPRGPVIWDMYMTPARSLV
jgi:hypothetical protein